MSNVVYRVPGYPSAKSLAYFKALTDAGWPEEAVEPLKAEIARFESASVRDPFEECLHVFTHPWDECHHPFLKSLNKYIQALSKAERTEELQRKATSDSRDSIAAATLLAQLTGDVPEGQVKSSNNGVSLIVNMPKMPKEAKAQ